MNDDPRAQTPEDLGPENKAPYLWGDCPEGFLEAFEAFKDALGETMDVYRLVVSYDVGQNGFVSRGFLSDAASQRSAATLANETAGRLNDKFGIPANPNRKLLAFEWSSPSDSQQSS